MTIKILGRRCRCSEVMKERALKALRELHVDAAVEKIENLEEIWTYGILATPVLIIDDQVIVQGRVPPVDMLKKLIVERN